MRPHRYNTKRHGYSSTAHNHVETKSFRSRSGSGAHAEVKRKDMVPATRTMRSVGCTDSRKKVDTELVNDVRNTLGGSRRSTHNVQVAAL
jgi:hypothetical protein